MHANSFFVFYPNFYANLIMANEQFNNVKNLVVYKVINFDRNIDILKVVPHIRYLDLAIVFYLMFPETVDTENKKLVMIKNDMMKAWDITTQELMDVASENTPKLLGLKVQSLYSTIAQYIGDYEFYELAEMEEDTMPLYIASNKSGCHGASVMLYKDFLKNISLKLKADIYVIPCSIHEIIVVKAIKDCQIDTSDLRDLIAYVNMNDVPENEILSNNLYYYSRGTNELSFAN